MQREPYREMMISGRLSVIVRHTACVKGRYNSPKPGEIRMKNKKIIIAIILLINMLPAINKAKWDSLTNFDNYRRHTIRIKKAFFRQKIDGRPVVWPSDPALKGDAEEYLEYTREIIVFSNQEGAYEDLSKEEIDALPESPYKFYLLKRHLALNFENPEDMFPVFKKASILNSQSGLPIRN